MSDRSMKTIVAFHIWRILLFITIGTYILGVAIHIGALLAAPWLTLRTQATVHAGVPVVLTAVKFVTVPTLLLLTPWARHHATFEAWSAWSSDRVRKLEKIVEIPWTTVKTAFLHAKSRFISS